MSQFTVATSRELTLGQLLLSTGSDTSITLNSSETITASRGVLKIGSGDEAEWVYFGGLTNNGDGTYTATSCVRGLDYDATSTSDATDANKKDHAIGDIAEMVLHSVDINEYVQNDADTTLTGDNTFTGTNTFSGTSKVLFVAQNVTTSQRDLLTGVDIGAKIYNTTDDQLQIYNGSTWDNIPYGAVYEFAKEAQKGLVEVSSITDQQNATVTGSSGAGVVVRTEDLVKAYDGTQAYKIVVLNSDGQIDEGFLANSASKFGGDGSDGTLTTGATISGSGYIVKNYSSMTPGNNTITTNGSGTILHLKCFGDCDLTNTTIDLSGKGGTGGGGGNANLSIAAQDGGPGTVGTPGNSTFLKTNSTTYGSGGTGSGVGADGAINTPFGFDESLQSTSRIVYISAGSGGGGGGGGYNLDMTGMSSGADSGGDGGAGGGALILEVRGNLTLSSTTINCDGSDGNDGEDGNVAPEYHAGGGGGGGGGGSVVIMYNGTLSGSVTPSVSGGTGGARGGVTTTKAGGGGGGGASIKNTGAAGSSGAGGNGGDGVYVLFQNQLFA